MQSLMHFSILIRLSALLLAGGALAATLPEETCDLAELDAERHVEESALLQRSQESVLMQVKTSKLMPLVTTEEEPGAGPAAQSPPADMRTAAVSERRGVAAGVATPTAPPPPVAAQGGSPASAAPVAAAGAATLQKASISAGAGLAPGLLQEAAAPGPAAYQAEPGAMPTSQEIDAVAAEAMPKEPIERLRRRLRAYIRDCRRWLSQLLATAKPIIPEEREDTAQLIAFVLFSIVIQSILGSLFAHAYVDAFRAQPEVDMSKRGASLHTWSSGLFRDFLCDPKICFFSCCCPCLRWADTLHTLGIMSFWAAFWLSISCIVLTELTYGLFWVFLLIGLVYFRHRLRKKFKMETNGGWTYAGDFARYCLCMPCTLAQDARHVEEACRCDHPAVLSGTLLQIPDT